MVNKCAHINDVCNLQSPICANVNGSAMENQLICIKDNSNMNYVTANYSVQKTSFEPNVSDSVLSLRNYSTILHSSSHPLYKTQSPKSIEKMKIRQTSTPMHQNLVVVKSPDSNQCCSSCLVTSSSSSQASSIHSDSDTSPVLTSNDQYEVG